MVRARASMAMRARAREYRRALAAVVLWSRVVGESSISCRLAAKGRSGDRPARRMLAAAIGEIAQPIPSADRPARRASQERHPCLAFVSRGWRTSQRLIAAFNKGSHVHCTTQFHVHPIVGCAANSLVSRRGGAVSENPHVKETDLHNDRSKRQESDRE